MDQFRQAKCTQCAASFKVPATFTAAKAKCPKCGGVVEVGEVQGAAPKAEASTPKPVPASVPAAKPAAAPAPKPAAAPAAAKPAAPKPAAAAPAAKPAAAAAAKPAAPSVRSAAESAASKVKAGAATKPAARKGKEEDDDGEKHERKRHAPKKKSMAPAMIGLGGLLLFGGIGGWYFGIKLPAEEKAHKEAQEAATAKRLADQAEQAAKDKAEMDAANAGHNADLAGAAAAKGEDVKVPDAAKAGNEAEAAAKVATQEASAPAKQAGEHDDADSGKPIEEIDLTLLPELPKYSKTTDEQWAKMQEDAKLLTNPASGAAGNRAGKRLEEAGRAAVPALLNQFRTINPAVEDGFRAGDLIQKMLERICKGMNFGWKYSTQPKDVYYNKKAIQSWFKQWEKVGEDDAAWAKFTKQDVKKTEGDAEGGDAPAPKPKSGLDDF